MVCDGKVFDTATITDSSVDYIKHTISIPQEGRLKIGKNHLKSERAWFQAANTESKR